MIEQHKVLVIGDIMVDTYYYGGVSRISPEAPVPVFLKKGEHSVLGGAANVVANLYAAGQKVGLLSVVGNDSLGKKVQKMVETYAKAYIAEDCLRPTTEKIRFIANGAQQLLRMDREVVNDIANDIEKILVTKFKEIIDEYEIVVLSDYCKGLLTESFSNQIISISNTMGKKVIVDAKDKNIKKYRGSYLIKPNLKELKELSGIDIYDENDIFNASKIIINATGAQMVLTTRGGDGMTLVQNEQMHHFKASTVEVFDVTGAGDTSVAYLTAAIVNGWDIDRAIDFANVAAGIQVSKQGTSLVYLDEVLSLFKDGDISNIKAEQIRQKYQNKKVVFTNGCFDILHVGHVQYLKEAAKLGDVLVVGLNSDESVRRLKGSNRPINSERDRMEILMSLEFVDYVYIFNEDTPYELIKIIQPDILVKGGDYLPEKVVGKDIVEARGGEVVIMPFVEGKSTTKLINEIRSK